MNRLNMVPKDIPLKIKQIPPQTTTATSTTTTTTTNITNSTSSANLSSIMTPSVIQPKSRSSSSTSLSSLSSKSKSKRNTSSSSNTTRPIIIQQMAAAQRHIKQSNSNNNSNNNNIGDEDDDEVAIIDDYDITKGSESHGNNIVLSMNSNGGVGIPVGISPVGISTTSPMILATSVESTNELLPSLSHISLLSLRDSLERSPGYNNGINQSPKLISRPPSFSHSRVSSFHSHQRHLLFQSRRNSSSNTITNNNQTTTNPFLGIGSPAITGPLNTNSSSTQPINIISGEEEPDTPVFGPTSLADSPSHFNLASSHTGSAFNVGSFNSATTGGINGSYGSSSTVNIARHPLLSRSNSNLHFGIGPAAASGTGSASDNNLGSLNIGDRSPFLAPVQEDSNVPMTPLMLSHRSDEEIE